MEIYETKTPFNYVLCKLEKWWSIVYLVRPVDNLTDIRCVIYLLTPIIIVIVVGCWCGNILTLQSDQSLVLHSRYVEFL